MRMLPPIASVPGWLLGTRRFELSDALVDSFERVDTERIATAAATVAYVVEEMNLRRFAGRAVAPVILPTRIGSIVLRGASNDVWEATEAPALLVDTGGDDRYYGPRRGPALRPRWRLRPLPVARRSQGTGSHGVGVLFDEGGDYLYEAEGFRRAQLPGASGSCSIRAGADWYVVHNSGQGFGFTRGFGGLIDARGADVYTADPGDPSLGGSLLYASDQLAGQPSSSVAGNHSFAQGCGAGHRPDWPDPGLAVPGRDSASFVTLEVTTGSCRRLRAGVRLRARRGYAARWRRQRYLRRPLLRPRHCCALGRSRSRGRRWRRSVQHTLPRAGASSRRWPRPLGRGSRQLGRRRYLSSVMGVTGSGIANGIGVFVDDGGRD